MDISASLVQHVERTICEEHKKRVGSRGVRKKISRKKYFPAFA
jgi:hypothetical protein